MTFKRKKVTKSMKLLDAARQSIKLNTHIIHGSSYNNTINQAFTFKINILSKVLNFTKLKHHIYTLMMTNLHWESSFSTKIP